VTVVVWVIVLSLISQTAAAGVFPGDFSVPVRGRIGLHPGGEHGRAFAAGLGDQPSDLIALQAGGIDGLPISLAGSLGPRSAGVRPRPRRRAPSPGGARSAFGAAVLATGVEQLGEAPPAAKSNRFASAGREARPASSRA